MNHSSEILETDANRDPITGAPGSHPVGTGLGAALGGAAAGAAAGTVVGPVGTVIGAAVGAIVGGYAGKSVAEAVDPTVEDAYWRDNFKTRPYAETGSSFEQYEPAYRYGAESFGRYPGRSFEAAEGEMAGDWDRVRGSSSLDWERAKHATRDAWNRLADSAERVLPGDSDRDGK
jgi:hypothetical protein